MAQSEEESKIRRERTRREPTERNPEERGRLTGEPVDLLVIIPGPPHKQRRVVVRVHEPELVPVGVNLELARVGGPLEGDRVDQLADSARLVLPRGGRDTGDSVVGGDLGFVDRDLGQLAGGGGVLQGVGAARAGCERKAVVRTSFGGRGASDGRTRRWRCRRLLRSIERDHLRDEDTIVSARRLKKARTWLGQLDEQKWVPCSMMGPIEIDFVHQSGLADRKSVV